MAGPAGRFTTDAWVDAGEATTAMTDGDKTRRVATDDDISDLLTLLQWRFGPVSDELAAKVRKLTDVSQIDHLILAAANAPTWDVVASELREPGFRMTGFQFDPHPEGACP